MERTITLDLNDQRARANLADFGAEVDALIKALSRVDVNLVIEDSTLRAVQKRIDSLSSVVEIDLFVDTDQLDSAVNEVADLSGTVVDIDVDVATGDLDEATNQIGDLSTTAEVRVDVDDSVLLFALGLVAELSDNISSNLNVNTAELDAAVREANSFPDPIDTEIQVDDSALSEAAGFANGGAFGNAVNNGFSGSLDLGRTTDLVTAQLGLSVDAAEQAGEVAATLYAGAWGDSVGQIGEALTAVGQNLVDLNSVGEAELENLTIKSLDLATALDEDVGGVTRTVGQLVRTGLARDFDEAFDIISAGLQSGANRGEDLLDTFNEYGTSFAALGFNAQDALTILNNGLDAGVDNTDRIADSLREFRVRIQDGTVAGIEGFDQLGLSASKLEADIERGGGFARGALEDVVVALGNIEDPVERDRLAFQIFGTQLEDFGVDAVEVFGGLEGALLDVSGATEQLGQDLNDNAATKVEEFRRTALLNLTNFVGNTLIPLLEQVGPPLLAGLQSVGDFLATNLLPLLSNAFQFLSEQILLFATALQTGTTDGSFLQDVAVFILNDLIPAIGELRDSFVNDVLPEIAAFIQDSLLPALQDIGEIIVNDVLPAWVQFADIFVNDVLPVLVSVGTFIGSVLVPAFTGFASILVGDVLPVVLDVIGIFFNLLQVLDDLELLIPLLVVAVALLAGPFGLIGAAILGVITLVVQLYQRFEIVRTVVDGVIDVIQFLVGILVTLGSILFDIGSAVARYLIDSFATLGPIIRLTITIFSALIDVLRSVAGTVADRLSNLPALIGGILATIGNLWDSFWSGLGGIASQRIDQARGFINTGLAGLRNVLSGILSGLSFLWDAFWNGFGGTAVSAITGALGQIRAGLGNIASIISSALGTAANIVVSIWNLITGIFTTSISRIASVVFTGFQQIRQFFNLDQVIAGVRIGLSLLTNVFGSVFSGLFTIVSTIWGRIGTTINTTLSNILRRVVSVLSAVANFWVRIWGTIGSTVRSVALTISSFMNVIYNAIQRILAPILEALRLLGLLGSAVSSLPSPGDLIPGLPSLPDPGGIVGGIGGIIGGIIPGIGNLFGDGGVVDKPTLAMIGERGGREAIVPEYASMASIKAILGKTNILDRLAQDFSAQQRSVFADFNDRASTDASLSGPAAGGGEMIVDRSTHQYDFNIVDGTGTMASKQRTASSVVSEIKRRRKPPARPGPGSWRSSR